MRKEAADISTFDPALETRITDCLRDIGELHQMLARFALGRRKHRTELRWVLDLEPVLPYIRALRAEARAILAQLDAGRAGASLDPELRKQLRAMLTF